MTIEVIQVVASIGANGENWEAQSYWRMPEGAESWRLFRLQVSTSLCDLLRNNQWLYLGCRVKVRGRIERAGGAEAERISKRLSGDGAPSAASWTVAPLAEVRYTLKGKVRLEQ